MSIEAPASPKPKLEQPRSSLAGFLQELLVEQQRLQTPVVRASSAYNVAKENTSDVPSPEAFRDLIPLSKPSAGEQYAFEVDLDACSGCKACVSACHSLNGLDDNEAWRDVGLLVSTGSSAPWHQTVTTACHHCADPACLNGCPVAAYEKDPNTGIVRHLDDQCIGCQYCILKCPYDVPKYNERLGIVRKCDMCHQRLAVGEAPACAQACPTQAISIVKISTFTSTTATGPDSATTTFLPGAPDPAYTKPTTRYVSARGLPSGVQAADADALRPQHAHLPLVAMLTLTQLGIGLLFTAELKPPAPPDEGLREFVTYYVTNYSNPLAGLMLLSAGLGASVLHLGQPTRAWRFFLGLRTSWLSREILAFNLLAPVAFATLIWPNSPLLRATFVALGAAAIACSAMIYIDTRRKFWGAAPTCIRFFSTAAIAALIPLSASISAVALFAKLSFEAFQSGGDSTSSRLLRGPLLGLLAVRFGFGAGVIVALLTGQSVVAFAFFAAGELAERSLFFQAVDAPKMPGHAASP